MALSTVAWLEFALSSVLPLNMPPSGKFARKCQNIPRVAIKNMGSQQTNQQTVRLGKARPVPGGQT